jgi:hypothetical protein
MKVAQQHCLRRRLCRSGLGVAFVLSTVVLWAPHGEGHDLRIGTRTSLTATATAKGTRVSVDGFLRDNVGQGIEGQAIRLDFRDVTEPTLQISRDVSTDRTGRFYLNARLAPGHYLGVAYFSGREYYYAADRATLDEVSTALSDLTLVITTPSLIRDSTREFAVTLTATSEGLPVGQLPLQLRMDDRTRKASTGETGTETITVQVGANAGPELLIEARFPGSLDFRNASATSRVRILTDPLLTLAAANVRARLERGVQIDGKASDRHGPLRGRLVEIAARQGEGGTRRLQSTTDDLGAFSVFVPEGELQQGPLALRARLQVPRSEAVESPAVTLEVEKTGLGMIPWALLVVIAAASLVAAALSPRDGHRKRPSVTQKERRKGERLGILQARSPRLEAIGPSERPPPVPATATTVAGILWNAQTDEAIGGGEVAATDGSRQVAAACSAQDGSFVLADLPAGRLTLRVSRKGYVSASHNFRIPHGGELSWVRFPLTPVRVVIRALYVALVEDVLESQPSWGEHTPRQVFTLLLEAVDALGIDDEAGEPPEGLSAFRAGLQHLLDSTRGQGDPVSPEELVTVVINLVEEVYYSGRDHDEDLVSVTERLSDRVRRSARSLDR